jgi:hypothetical protein
MNRLYTQTDNLTFIRAFFRGPFVSVTERKKRWIFHQAKKGRETISRSKTHPRNNVLSLHREEKGVRWTNS